MLERPPFEEHQQPPADLSLIARIGVKLALASLFVFGAGCARQQELPQGKPFLQGTEARVTPALSALPPNTTLIGTPFVMHVKTKEDGSEKITVTLPSTMRLRVGERTFRIACIEVEGRYYRPGDTIPLFHVSMATLPTDIIWHDGIIITADHKERKGRIDITFDEFRSIIQSLHGAQEGAVHLNVDVRTTVTGIPFFDGREGRCTITFERMP